MIEQSITAVYQKGMLKPKTLLKLTEDEEVQIRITRTEATSKPLLNLRGLWQGAGDLTYDEITALTHQIHEEHVAKLLVDIEADET